MLAVIQKTKRSLNRDNNDNNPTTGQFTNHRREVSNHTWGGVVRSFQATRGQFLESVINLQLRPMPFRSSCRIPINDILLFQLHPAPTNIAPSLPFPLSPLTSLTNRQPSQKTFRTKRTLAVKLKQNKPIPHWIRLRTGSTIRYNAKRRHWRRTKLGI